MELSIVIPTYNERDNVVAIASRIQASLPAGTGYEILFVDDSSDDTPEVLKQLAKKDSHVRWFHRSNRRGLAQAVAEGIEASDSEYIIVMDADLQHPPEILPLIVERLRQYDVVIPSRFIPGGSDGGLNGWRKLVSWVARKLANLAIRRLRDISDSTSGYFGLRRAVVDHIRLEPVGWKILLEILVKGKYRTVHELPYSFAVRDQGVSKMCLREQWNYLRHVARLLWTSPQDMRFILFCLIGAIGVVVNMKLLNFFISLGLWGDLQASCMASFLAMVHNFLLNNWLTWRDRSLAPGSLVKRFLPYLMVSCLGILVTGLTAKGFTLLGWDIYAGQFAGIVAAACWSFNLNNRWVWLLPASSGATAKLVVTQESVPEKVVDETVL